MPTAEYATSVPERAQRLIELATELVACQSCEELGRRAPPIVSEITGSCLVLLYIQDPRLPGSRFFHQGASPEIAAEIEALCAERFGDIAGQGAQPTAIETECAELLVYPLRLDQDTTIGIVGLAPQSETSALSAALWQRCLDLLARTLDRLVERAETSSQLAHLNAYLTISSALAQSLGLHDVLDIALYSCMDLVSAEAASVLLLDDEGANFGFYQVEGPAKPVLMSATFPADKGLAGSVLRTRQSEIVNDVQSDPRFYKAVDSQTGFVTRNLIAVPLIAGNEPVGVLEVLNTADREGFVEDERLLLLSLAEEIAFAIRNAKTFEYVADSYCRQRQGHASCRGCERPLGSWTPCVRHRDVDL